MISDIYILTYTVFVLVIVNRMYSQYILLSIYLFTGLAWLQFYRVFCPILSQQIL